MTTELEIEVADKLKGFYNQGLDHCIALIEIFKKLEEHQLVTFDEVIESINKLRK